MKKKHRSVLLAVSFCFLFLNSLPAVASPIVIKHFNSYNTTQGSILNDRLTNPNNFGPNGTVRDVSFMIEDISEITSDSISGADIFIAAFPYEGTQSINDSEARLLENFVANGGNLLVSSDANPISTSSANAIGSFFGSVNFGGGTDKSSINVSDKAKEDFPGITNGPFGKAHSFSWERNATARIESEGNSTIIDNFGMVSVIPSTATSGSVVFYADTDLLYVNMPSPYYLGDWDNLRLNVFSYFAENSRVNNPIPEPGTITLFGFGLLGLAGIGRRKAKHI